MPLSQDTFNQAYGAGAWMAPATAGGSFLKAMQDADRMALEKRKLDIQEQGLGAYNLGTLLGLPPSDPRAKIPVSAKQAPGVVAQGVGMGGVPEAASTQAGQAAGILSGAASLGQLAQEAAKEAKGGGISSIPLIQDIVPGIQTKFPATAGSISPKYSQYLTQAQSTLDAIGRERSGGAITGEEWLSFRQFLPQPHDYAQGPESVKMKLDGLANEYQQKLIQKADTIKNPVERERWKAEKLATVDAFKQDMYKSFLPQEQAGAFDNAALLQMVRARRAQQQQGR